MTKSDLDTMFGMFDPTHRNSVTVQQAKNALNTIVGPNAELELHGTGAERMDKEAFVRQMYKAILASTPTQGL